MSDQKSPDAPDDPQATLAAQMDAATRAVDLDDHPDAGASPVDRFINSVVEVAGVTLLAGIVLLVFFNAAGRYLFQFTFLWADEVVIGVLPWLGMCGMFLSIRRRHVIRLDFFVHKLPEVVRQPALLFAYTLSAAVFVYLAIVSFDYLQLFGGDRTIYLKLREGWFTSALVIGSAMAALAYAYELFRDLRARRSEDA